VGQVAARRRRHRRWPFVVVILAVVVAAGLIATNFIARSVAEQTIASRIQHDTGAQSVSASINSSPFLYDVLVRGRIQGVHVVANGVPVGLVHLTQVTVDASDVRLDRHQLVFDQQVHIVGIESASLTAVIKPEGLGAVVASGADLLGLRVTVANGHDLVVDILGQQVYKVDLTSNPLLPDCDFSLQDVPGGYSLTCHMAPVPPSLLDVLSKHV
jgi:hypothetical protein